MCRRYSVASAAAFQQQLALNEDLGELEQFLLHICRAVDDALLCQRLAVGSFVPSPCTPTNVRQLVLDRVNACMPYFNRYVLLYIFVHVLFIC